MANFKYHNRKKNDFGNFHGAPNPGSLSIRKKLSSVDDRPLSAQQLEERFCSTVGGISWEDVVQNQKYMYQHEKILEWKDSAVEEAFWDAKNRFWAKMHNQPCDGKLPDQDVFIDKIDWNSTVDPKLLSDLENWEIDSCSESENHNGGVIIGIPSMLTQCDMTPTGWGDAEDVKPQPEYVVNRGDLTPTGWGDAEDVGNSHWDDNRIKKEETTFTTGWDDDYGNVPQNTAWDRSNKVSRPSWDDNRKQQNNGYDRKGDNGGWSTSRYKISRFEHHNNNNNNNYPRPLDNYGGRKGSISCERPLYAWKPVTRRW